jgi:hypothetical protein
METALKVSIAADYAGVTEASDSENVDPALAHPVGYALASREAERRIIGKDVWHGRRSFTEPIRVHSGFTRIAAWRGSGHCGRDAETPQRRASQRPGCLLCPQYRKAMAV